MMSEADQAKIFLSYASERADLAADVAAALTVAGHEVFFDREQLSPGEPYDNQIRDRIAQSDLFVVLISAEILKPESYVLTELKFAKQALARRATRILPVVIRPVDYRSLDPHLRRLTALYPEGNTAAEVAARANEMIQGDSTPSAAALRPDVAARQREAYEILWSLTGVLPKWGQEGTRSYADLEKLSRKLRTWYFDHAGGLFFSRRSYSRYAELQNALETLRSDDSADPITADDYEAIRRLCSALRHQVAEDLGTRR